MAIISACGKARGGQGGGQRLGCTCSSCRGDRPRRGGGWWWRWQICKASSPLPTQAAARAAELAPANKVWPLVWQRSAAQRLRSCAQVPPAGRALQGLRAATATAAAAAAQCMHVHLRQLACNVLPSPISSAMRQRPPRATPRRTPSRWKLRQGGRHGRRPRQAGRGRQRALAEVAHPLLRQPPGGPGVQAAPPPPHHKTDANPPHTITTTTDTLIPTCTGAARGPLAAAAAAPPPRHHPAGCCSCPAAPQAGCR